MWSPPPAGFTPQSSAPILSLALTASGCCARWCLSVTTFTPGQLGGPWAHRFPWPGVLQGTVVPAQHVDEQQGSNPSLQPPIHGVSSLETARDCENPKSCHTAHARENRSPPLGWAIQLRLLSCHTHGHLWVLWTHVHCLQGPRLLPVSEEDSLDLQTISPLAPGKCL